MPSNPSHINLLPKHKYKYYQTELISMDIEYVSIVTDVIYRCIILLYFCKTMPRSLLHTSRPVYQCILACLVPGSLIKFPKCPFRY